jgi:hypothetical protein
MEHDTVTRWALVLVLGAALMPAAGIAFQGTTHEAPHQGWNEVVRLLSVPQRAIDAETVERLLGVTLSRRTRSVDDYDAWIPGNDEKTNASLTLNYRPAPYRGHAGTHDSNLLIFVSDFECVSPTRMREDLLRAGFTTTSKSTSSTTREYYTLGTGRWLRVSYAAGPTGANLQVWAINHHTTAEDRRCVGEIYIGETG